MARRMLQRRCSPQVGAMRATERASTAGGVWPAAAGACAASELASAPLKSGGTRASGRPPDAGKVEAHPRRNGVGCSARSALHKIHHLRILRVLKFFKRNWVLLLYLFDYL